MILFQKAQQFCNATSVLQLVTILSSVRSGVINGPLSRFVYNMIMYVCAIFGTLSQNAWFFVQLFYYLAYTTFFGGQWYLSTTADTATNDICMRIN